MGQMIPTNERNNCTKITRKVISTFRTIRELHKVFEVMVLVRMFQRLGLIMFQEKYTLLD